MKKYIAAAAVVAAAAGSFLLGAGHADAQQVCVEIQLNGDVPAIPAPVALPVAPPLPLDTGICIPPDGGVGGLPTLPELPGVPGLPGVPTLP